VADCVVGIDLSGVSGGTHGRTVLACLVIETPLRVSDRLIVPRGAEGDRILLDWIEQRRPAGRRDHSRRDENPASSDLGASNSPYGPACAGSEG
jgi:hypothetical protein